MVQPKLVWPEVIWRGLRAGLGRFMAESKRKAEVQRPQRGALRRIGLENIWNVSGDTIDEFLEQYPTVQRQQAIDFLEQASERLLATA